jgi:NAD(P)-dependent dehydrogenase (short-subunit alcohol dehydrogenase family)
MFSPASAPASSLQTTVIGDTLRGVDTKELDPTTASWLTSMKNFRHPDGRMLFENETWVITGGASGIGQKTCVLAAELGARVHFLDKFPFEFAPAGSGSNQISQHLSDITADDGSVERTVRQIGATHGISKIVLNAGIFPETRVNLADPQENLHTLLQQVYDINAQGNAKALIAAFPYLTDKRNAGTVPVVPILGTKNLFDSTHPGYAMANGAKAQIAGFIEAQCAGNYERLKKEGKLADYIHVRSLVICPDAVFDTKIWGATAEERAAKLLASSRKAGYGDEVDKFMVETTPSGTKFTSWSTAQAICNFSAPWFDGLNTQVIRLDGGRTRTGLV